MLRFVKRGPFRVPVTTTERYRLAWYWLPRRVTWCSYADEGTQCVGMVQPCSLRRVRLADRIAAWFGYVPAERLADTAILYPQWKELAKIYDRPSQTGPECVQPAILVASDFKRGIPCS